MNKKVVLLSLFAMVLIINICAQSSSSLNSYTVSEVDEKPVFANGKMSPENFLKIYLNYPIEAYSKKIEGTVVLVFDVDTSGIVSNIKIDTGIDSSLNAEALRIGDLIPPFAPAKKNGKVVNVKTTFRIPFLRNGASIKAESNLVNNTISKKPLYIIDGAIVDKDINLDANTIETIRVIKGKKAIEQYGDRAEDGVILVTTKQFPERRDNK